MHQFAAGLKLASTPEAAQIWRDLCDEKITKLEAQRRLLALVERPPWLDEPEPAREAEREENERRQEDWEDEERPYYTPEEPA